LTIKSISNTKYSMSFFLRCFPSGRQTNANLWEAANTCSKYCPSNIRLSKIRLLRYCSSEDAENQHPGRMFTFDFFGTRHSLTVAVQQRQKKHGGPG